MHALRRHLLLAGGLITAWAPSARAQVAFADTFSAGASPLWGNQRGAWTATGGRYDAQQPSNAPPTFSLLPYDLTDYSISVTINQVRDGGLWLRSSVNAPMNEIFNGVLLVTGGFNGSDLYWHTVTNGAYSGVLNSAHGVFVPGVTTSRIRVDVLGDSYSAFVDNVLVTSLTTTPGQYASGMTGLYDFSGQTFDDVLVQGSVVTPEPASLALIASGLIGVAGVVRRRRR